VLSGLQPTDSIIVDPSDSLINGAEVRPKEVCAGEPSSSSSGRLRDAAGKLHGRAEIQATPPRQFSARIQRAAAGFLQGVPTAGNAPSLPIKCCVENGGNSSAIPKAQRTGRAGDDFQFRPLRVAEARFREARALIRFKSRCAVSRPSRVGSSISFRPIFFKTGRFPGLPAGPPGTSSCLSIFLTSWTCGAVFDEP